MKEMIYAVLLAIVLAAPVVAGAEQREPRSGGERATPVAKITQEQATKIALERVPGKVTEVKIERKRGRNVYVVEILTADGEKDVFVDTESGQIVGID